MRSKSLLAIALIALVAVPLCAAPAKRRAVSPALPLWNGLEPGPVPIGFKAWLLRAQASEFHHGPQHLVQISVWYPAVANSGTPMTFRDYALLRATENTYDEPSDSAIQAALDEFASLLDTPMIARQNAVTPINVVRAPIVFIAVDAGQSAANVATFAEYIASHNFVVVTIPSDTRLTSNDPAARPQEQADDIDRAASAIGDWPNAINVPVSVVAEGLGLEAAQLYAAQHPVNLVIDLRTKTPAEILAALNAVWDPIRPR